MLVSPNAFENELTANPNVAYKEELKAVRNDALRKRQISSWRAGNLDRMTMARLIAKSDKDVKNVLAELSEKRSNPTKLLVKKLREHLIKQRFG